MDLIWKLAAILALVGVNAFCVAAEFALGNARISRLKTQADAGDKKSARAVRVIQNLDDYLAGAQLGITVTSLALGWIGAVTLASLVPDTFFSSDSSFVVLGVHALAATFIFICIAYLHLVVGEQTPKLLALTDPEKIARVTAGPLMLFTHVFWFIVRVPTRSARSCLRILGMHPTTHSERANEREELLELLSESHNSGVMDDSHAEMISNIFDFSSTNVRQAMTPRTDMHAVERSWPMEKVIQEVRDSGSSRLPVYQEDLDHIVGILLVKDLLNFLDSPSTFDAVSVMREAYFIPPTMHVDKLLKELQRLNTHLAIVVDEYGGVLGLITLEDLIEEIVGEIFDEFDQVNESEPPQAATEGTSNLPGNLLIHELNERYHLELATSDYVTLAGMILAILGHVPSVGESAQIDGVTFKVVTMDRQRIERVEVTVPESSNGSPDRYD